MKTTPHLSPLLTLAFAAALLAAPVALHAQATAPNAPSVPAAVPMNVSGKVEAKSDTTLTVNGRTISTTSATTYSKKGASIGSGDIKVGDKVNVVTTDNGQVAVSVDVIASE